MPAWLKFATGYGIVFLLALVALWVWFGAWFERTGKRRKQ